MTPPTRAPVDGPREEVDDGEEVDEGAVATAVDAVLLVEAFEPAVLASASCERRTGAVTSILHRQKGAASLAPSATISSV